MRTATRVLSVDMPVERFDEWVLQPENAEQNYEYILGEISEVISNGFSSEIGILVGGFVAVYVLQNGLGHVTGADGGYMVMGERYIPDAAFISKQRQPKASKVAYNPLAPDLAIEVLSPTDEEEKVRAKIANYLAAGTTLWLFDPVKARAYVHQPGKRVIRLNRLDVLDGGTLLPGFTLELATIFPEDDEDDSKTRTTGKRGSPQQKKDE